MTDRKIEIEAEVLEKIKNSTTEHLKNELYCMRENIIDEPYVAEDAHYCAIADAVEEELRSRGEL